MGVVSYGLYNVSGRLIPQPIETNLVEGSAMIYSLLSYNASPPDSASAYGASLQLNVLMKVFSGGRNYTYWLQEIRAFDTRNRTDFIYDNIWNNTVFGANMSSSTVSGPGKIHSGEPDKYFSYSRSYYFYSPSAKVPYSMPLNVSPVIKVSIQNGNPVVSFGTSTASGDSYYESVTLQIPASSAYILVTPFYNTPNSAGKSGVRYDAEFVFAGEESDEISYFSRLNSSIWIYYAGSNGRLLPFPSAYTFGSDTGEASQNLSVSAAAHGAWVGTGTLNPATDIILAGALNNLTTSTVATTTSTVIATTSTAIATSTVPPVTAQTTARTTLPTTVPATSAYTTVAAYNASNVTAPAGQSGGQGSSSGIGTDVIVIVFALAVLYFLSRKVAKGKAPSR